MKWFLFNTILAISFLANQSLSAQNASENVQTISIATSAKCGICKTTLETQLPKTSGIANVKLDVPTHILTVRFNPKKTSAEKIRAAINKIGYDADDQKATDKQQALLKPCCRRDASGHQQ